MRYRINIITLTIALSLSTFSCKNKVVKKKFVYDYAGILNQNQYNSLDSIVRIYKLNTSSEIYIYTIDRITDSVNRNSYGLQLINDLGVGLPGLNNGALILISMQDRHIELQLAHGFEWLIDQPERDKIVSKMSEYFSKAEFFQGISSAVNKIIVLTRSTTWRICEKGDSVNCILKVRIKSILNKSNSTLKILTTDDKELIIDYTKSMTKIIDTITRNADHNIQIFCRPIGKNSNEALLLGIN